MTDLQSIKDELAKKWLCKDYEEFKSYARDVDTDIVFIMDSVVNKVAKRYAEEALKEAAARITMEITPYAMRKYIYQLIKELL